MEKILFILFIIVMILSLTSIIVLVINFILDSALENELTEINKYLQEDKKQKTLLNKIHTIKEYLFDLEADLEEEKAENNEKAEIIKKALDYIEKNCLEFNVKYACQGLNNDKVDILLDILRGEDNESN